jgi:hypothetical protein
MKMRLCLAGVIACSAITMGWVAGCGSKSSPTAPSPAPTFIRALNVRGNTALTAPGQTSQLSAQATFSDGSIKDVTPTTQWSSSDKSVATISPTGLVTALAFGKTWIRASVPATGYSDGTFVTVLPDGTVIVSGRVTESGAFPIVEARVELVGGPMNGRVAMTDQFGQYVFTAVAGVLQVRATKDGYVAATQSVTGNPEQVNIELTPAVPYAAVGGVYRLVFTSSDSCHLPEEAVSRTYTATIDQAGARLTVRLSDAQFGTYFGATWNTFYGRVFGNTVSFTLNAGYDALYDGGVAEKLADTRYLMLAGTADADVTGSTMSARLAGTVSILTSPNNIWGPSLTCAASDHHLTFTRTATTTARRRL